MSKWDGVTWEGIELVCDSPKHRGGKAATIARAFPQPDNKVHGMPGWNVMGVWMTARGRREQEKMLRHDLDRVRQEHRVQMEKLGTLPDGTWVTWDPFPVEGAENPVAFTLRKYRFTCPWCPMDVQRSVSDMDLILDAASEAGETRLRVNRLG